MKNIHVCLVSDQPIPNLTSVLQFKPDSVVLLTTDDMQEKAEALKGVLNKKGFRVDLRLIKAYDINDVISVSESLIDEFRGCKVTLNITGGTKIGTLGTFQAFYTAGKEIFYVDTKDNKILKLFPEKEQADYPIKVSVPIADYLSVYGFQINSYVEDDSYILKRKDFTKYLAYTVSYKPYLIPEINSALHGYDWKSALPITVRLPKDDKLFNYLDLLEGVEKKDHGRIQISQSDSLMYLKGFWFEEYVYMEAKALVASNEIKLNVKGKWLTKGKNPPKNEFDVMFSKGNRLFLISCKTSNPDRKTEGDEEAVSKEYLYELVSLSDRALGLFGKRLLASARPINDPAVKKRAEILKVHIIDGKNILNLKKNLLQWIQKS
jgi:hypothetical protein